MLLLPTPPVSPTSSMTVLAEETSLEQASVSLLDDALARVLERISDDGDVRDFVDHHSHRFVSYSPDGEHELEWTEMHVDYCNIVERVITDELSVIGCTEESLLDHIMHGGDPLADRRLSRLLAKTDFFYFCAMMHAYDYASRCLSSEADGGDDEVGDYVHVDEECADAGAHTLSGDDEDEDDEGLAQLERSVATTAVRDARNEASPPRGRRW